MNGPDPPYVRDDAGSLRLLAGLNLAAGALCLAAIVFLCWHYARMHAAFLDVAAWKKQPDGGASLRAFFSIFVLYYRIGGALLAVGAIGNLGSALCIRMRRHRFLSLASRGLRLPGRPLRHDSRDLWNRRAPARFRSARLRRSRSIQAGRRAMSLVAHRGLSWTTLAACAAFALGATLLFNPWGRPLESGWEFEIEAESDQAGLVQLSISTPAGA